MRSKPKNPYKVKKYRVPYINALKAYAYGDMPFKHALKRLALFGFYTPQKDYMRKPDRMNVWDIMENKYEIFRYDAWRLNSYHSFSQEQTKDLGISPLYELYRTGEYDSLTYDTELMQSVIDDIRCVSLRRTICVLLWQGAEPIQIRRVMEEDFRAPPVIWSVDQIMVFAKLFWQVKDMNHNDWLMYGGMHPIPDNDDHYPYLRPIIEHSPKHYVTWHGSPMENIDNIMALEMVKAQQLRDACHDSSKEYRLRSSNSLNRTVANMEKILLDRRMSPPKPKHNPLEDVELVIQEERAKQLEISAEFMAMSEVDGDVSDPRDIESSKDDYLDQ